MYWLDTIDAESVGTLNRAQMDGSEMTVLPVERSLRSSPRSLALDSGSGRLYWVDLTSRKVNYFDLKTNSVRAKFYNCCYLVDS